jgi:hypothetical protein
MVVWVVATPIYTTSLVSISAGLYCLLWPAVVQIAPAFEKLSFVVFRKVGLVEE